MVCELTIILLFCYLIVDNESWQNITYIMIDWYFSVAEIDHIIYIIVYIKCQNTLEIISWAWKYRLIDVL